MTIDALPEAHDIRLQQDAQAGQSGQSGQSGSQVKEQKIIEFSLFLLWLQQIKIPYGAAATGA